MRTTLTLSVLLALAAGCDESMFGTLEAEFTTDSTAPPPAPEPEPTPEAPVDKDGDGVTAATDCNDNDVNVGAASAWLADDDGDGWGANNTTTSCVQLINTVAPDKGGDCDDDDASRYPGAPEVCDGDDNDCDGNVDNATGNVWYLDGDGDGYGDPSKTYVNGCDGANFLVANSGDCDDSDADVHPGADESCNGVDDNCDGATDEGVMITSYHDADEDGFGNVLTTTLDCSVSDGWVLDNTDCDDQAATTHPGAAESCNGVDDNCDGQTDEAEPDAGLCDDENNLTVDSCDGAQGCTNTDLMVELTCELPESYDPEEGYVCGAAAFFESEDGQYSEVLLADGTLTLTATDVCDQLADGGVLHTNSYVYLPDDPFFTWVGGEQVTVEDSDSEAISGTPGTVTVFPGGLDFVYKLLDFALCQP